MIQLLLCYYETAATAVPTDTDLTVTNLVGNNIEMYKNTNGSVNFDINNTSSVKYVVSNM
jgi:hypothetical protein